MTMPRTPIDLYNPDYSASSPRPPLTTRWDNTLDQVGVYAQDQIEWDRFVLTAGGRYDWSEHRQQDTARNSRAGL